MRKTSWHSKEYSMDDLKRFIQEFNQEHSRPPTADEVRKLSKLNKAPGMTVLNKHGGLSWVIEQAGLTPINPRRQWDNPVELKRQFIAFVREFMSQNDGRIPRNVEIDLAAQNRQCPSLQTLKKALGKTPNEIMYNMGLSTKRPIIIPRSRDGP